MKDTLKTIELLEEHIDRLAESGIYEIERDLLLERLRGLYATALSIEAITEEELLIGALVGLQEEGVEPAEEPIEEPVEEEVAEESVEEEVAEEEVAPVEEEVAPVEEEFAQEESVEVEPEVEPEHNSQEGLFALYEDEDEPTEVEDEPTEEPEVEEEPVEEVELELEPEPEVVEEPTEEPTEEPAEEAFEEYFEEEADRATVSLRNTIGVNDKIILMRDLFNGNGEYYDRVITKLDSFDSLDDAMIYIHDNYHWNSKSEGARLLVELLAHKLF